MNAAHFAELIERLKRENGLPSVLVTADKAVAAQVADAATEPFLNLCGRTNLKKLAAVLKRSAVHVCGDTGSSPLAVALERPVVTLVGPTDPDRIHPYGQRDNVLSLGVLRHEMRLASLRVCPPALPRRDYS